MSVPKFSSARSLNLPFSGRNERRRACRYLAVHPDSLVGWWEDSCFVKTPCRILDISLVGCLVESHRLPGRKEREPIWFHPRGVSETDWMEGILVGVRKPWFQHPRIRINFLAPFPDDSFRSLVFGSERLREIAVRESPEHEMDHYWR
jgi:hypothetical protein